MVERSLSMREVRESIPCISNGFVFLVLNFLCVIWEGLKYLITEPLQLKFNKFAISWTCNTDPQSGALSIAPQPLCLIQILVALMNYIFLAKNFE